MLFVIFLVFLGWHFAIWRKNQSDMAGALLDRVSRTARYWHASPQDEALVYTNLFYEKGVFVQFVVVGGVGDSRSEQITYRVLCFLESILENCSGQDYVLASN
jgi:hypothetical protein